MGLPRWHRIHLPVWETWVLSLGWKDPLEKEMATHSSIIAWEIQWTEEPGGLQSMGSQRVRHNLVTKQQLWLHSTEILIHVLHSKSQPALSRTWFSSSFRSSLETYFWYSLKKRMVLYICFCLLKYQIGLFIIQINTPS